MTRTNIHNNVYSRRRVSWGHTVIMIVLTVWFILIVIPFWNAIMLSFMSQGEGTRHPAALIPYGFTLENYKNLIARGGLGLAYQNTILISALGTAYGMLISTMMAYAFSQRFPGKRFFLLMMIFTMYFSGGVVPMYLLIKTLGLINNLSCIILMGGVSSFNIIIMKNSFENTPQALGEAARIDGANDIRIFFQIMLPLQAPLLATFSLFTAVGYWNEWFWSTLVLNKQGLQPLMVYLRSIVNTIDEETTHFSSAMTTRANVFPMGVRMCAVVMTMLPIMCVYPFLQRYFVKGITIGSVKM